jgi:hypothetical protein
MVSILGSTNSTACFLLPKASNLCNKGQCLEFVPEIANPKHGQNQYSWPVGNSQDKTFKWAFFSGFTSVTKNTPNSNPPTWMHRVAHHQFLPSPKSILFNVNRQMKSFGTKAYKFCPACCKTHVIKPWTNTTLIGFASEKCWVHFVLDVISC